MNLNAPPGAQGLDTYLETDESLALAARTTPAAFLPLYERFVARVYGYCFLRLGDKSAAEDATSEVFLKAINKLASYRGGSFAAWLFAITRNTVKDVYRRHTKLRLAASLDITDVETATPEASGINSALREALVGAIARLTDDQRAVIELQLSGWETRDIAASLGKSTDAVKMLRLRSLRRLQELLTAAGWSKAEIWSEDGWEGGSNEP